MIDFLNSPGVFSARATLGSDISYVFAVIFTCMFLGAGYLAMKKKGMAHHWMILVSLITMIAYFAYYYKVRRLGYSSFVDEISFQSSGWISYKVFKQIFYLHFLVVCVSVFMAIYATILGFRSTAKEGGRLVLIDKRIQMSKGLWIVSFAWLAFLSWWVFSVHHFGWGYRMLFLFFGYFLPAGIALTVNYKLPASERRHRVLGKICLVLLASLLVTNTLVYYVLYIR